MKEILTTKEVATLFRVGQRTVYRWIDSGRLEAFQTPGGHHRVRGDSVAKLFRSMTRQEPPA